jgi:hypothetical protein
MASAILAASITRTGDENEKNKHTMFHAQILHTTNECYQPSKSKTLLPSFIIETPCMPIIFSICSIINNPVHK